MCMYDLLMDKDYDYINTLSTASYWNDEEEEKKKAWDVRDGDFEKLEEYLREIHLSNDLNKCLERSGLIDRENLVGVELAGGVCWTAPLLFKLLDIKTMNYVEFSYHRIAKIAPILLEHYNIPPDRVKLIYGSFYDVPLHDKSMDFVILSQAMHHASEIERLLKEIDRIIRKDGVIVIIGEPIIGKNEIQKAHRDIIKDILCFKWNSPRIKLFMQNGCLGDDSEDEKVMGDRYYSLRSYNKMLNKHKYKNIYFDDSNNSFSFVCRKM